MGSIILKDQLKGIEESKARQIEAVFAPMVEMLKGFESAFDEIVSQDITEDLCKKAKRLRLDIAKIRTSADKERKSQKDEYLRASNAIQGVYNILKFAVVEKEEKLKEIENYYANLEKERKAKLQIERSEELEKYEVEVIPENLGDMSDDVWNNFIAGTKFNYETQKEAERKAEAERVEKERIKALHEKRLFQCSRLFGFIDNFDSIDFGDMLDEEYSKLINNAKEKREAYEKEQEAIRLENERLKKEREEAERKRKVELKKQEEEKARVEKEHQAKLEAERKEQAAILKKEREEKERLQKIETERIAKIEAEKQAKIEAEKKAQLAPDKEKLSSYALKLSNFLKENTLDLESEKAIDIFDDVEENILSTIKGIEEVIKSL